MRRQEAVGISVCKNTDTRRAWWCMNVHVVIAARGGRHVKSRLSSRLDKRQRERLVVAMLMDMLSSLRDVRNIDRVWVTTPTPALASLAAEADASVVPDTESSGLNGAFEQARVLISAEAPAATVLLLPGDLPLLAANEVEEVLLSNSSNGIVLVPSIVDGGTGALALAASCRLPLAFGPHSFAKHLAGAQMHGLKTHIVEARSLGMDIDRPADLEALLSRQVRGETGDLLRSWSINE